MAAPHVDTTRVRDWWGTLNPGAEEGKLRILHLRGLQPWVRIFSRRTMSLSETRCFAVTSMNQPEPYLSFAWIHASLPQGHTLMGDSPSANHLGPFLATTTAAETSWLLRVKGPS